MRHWGLIGCVPGSSCSPYPCFQQLWLLPASRWEAAGGLQVLGSESGGRLLYPLNPSCSKTLQHFTLAWGRKLFAQSSGPKHCITVMHREDEDDTFHPPIWHVTRCSPTRVAHDCQYWPCAPRGGCPSPPARVVVSAGPPCQCETLSLHPGGAGKGWLLGTDCSTEFQHCPEGGIHQRELSLPDSFDPTSINVFLHHCLPEGWGVLCQHCAAQRQPSFPGQGTNRAGQDEAVHSHSFKRQ